MLVVCSRDPRWLSNTWLFADGEGGHAVVVDTGGPPAPIVRAIEQHRLDLTHVLLTHHHPDHVAHNAIYRDRGAAVLGHPAEAELFERVGAGTLDERIEDGHTLETGRLHVRALHIPGHTLGQLAFVVEHRGGPPAVACTGDTLFRRSVGGNRGSGHTSFDDLRHSILDVLLALPDSMVLYPGHMETTTVAEERHHNPFVRLWRGDAPPTAHACTRRGAAAVLELTAGDYDGGHKCQVLETATGERAVVGGTSVQRDDGLALTD